MSDTEVRTVKNTEICKCGRVMSILGELDDYDVMGADGDRCCPDCGNEEFILLTDLQAQLQTEQWISVEKLPKEDGEYLAATGAVACGWISASYCKKTGWTPSLKHFPITHWKPIAPPTEREAKEQ